MLSPGKARRVGSVGMSLCSSGLDPPLSMWLSLSGQLNLWRYINISGIPGLFLKRSIVLERKVIVINTVEQI